MTNSNVSNKIEVSIDRLTEIKTRVIIRIHEFCDRNVSSVHANATYQIGEANS